MKKMNTKATATTDERKKGGKLKLAGLLIGGVAAGVGTGLLVRKMKKSGKLLDASLNQEDVDREDFEEDGDDPDPIPPAPAPTEPAETLEDPATETEENKGDDVHDNFVSNSVDATVGGTENTEDNSQYFQPSALVTEEEAELLNQLYLNYTTGTDVRWTSLAAFQYLCRLNNQVSLANDYLVNGNLELLETAKEELGKRLERTRKNVLSRTLTEFSTPVLEFIDEFIPRMNALMDKRIEELRKEKREA